MNLMSKLPEYTAVIRTLGTAGKKYQTLLDSLVSQTHKPSKIIVYLANGYDIPKETVGIEEVVYVRKGMVAQRALPYNEVDTEWMLMLDDDIAIESDGIERLFSAAIENNADVVACDPFPHDKMSLMQKIAAMVLLSAIPRIGHRDKGYTVNCLGTDVYNNRPGKVGWSTTNAGAAFICRKKDFLKIRFDEDLWLDQAPLAFPEDTVMFFKMHLYGLKILTHYNAGFTHLDGQTSTKDERGAKIAYSAARNNLIFYHLYVLPSIPIWKRIMIAPIRLYRQSIKYVYRFVKGKKQYIKERRQAKKDAMSYLSSLNV